LKKLIALALILMMLLSLTACGGKSETTQDKDSGQDKTQQAASEPASAPEKATENKGIVCVSYESYDAAWGDFNKHITGQSGDHEIVSVHQSTAMPLELRNLNYLLPLSFLGQSQVSQGKFDAAMETGMLGAGWADDVVLTLDEKEGYLLKGTDTQGNSLEIKVRYDDNADSLRLEGYKDGNLDMVFEYSKTPDGYAAQYHYETITGNDKFTPVYGLCTYRLIFTGTNGSCARFDDVSSEPDSIFGSIPDKQSFIEGATHWFTITDGEFTGKLGGSEF
jgi:predicted small lipoprotein YifL